MADIKIDGMKELSKALTALGRKAGGNALRRAVNAGATVIKREAKSRIPKGRKPHRTYKGRLVGGGFSSRSIKSASRLSKDKSFVSARIGVRREAFYATHFVEVGTKRMRARPWLEPAIRSKRHEAVRRIRGKLYQDIRKIANG